MESECMNREWRKWEFGRYIRHQRDWRKQEQGGREVDFNTVFYEYINSLFSSCVDGRLGTLISGAKRHQIQRTPNHALEREVKKPDREGAEGRGVDKQEERGQRNSDGGCKWWCWCGWSVREEVNTTRESVNFGRNRMGEGWVALDTSILKPFEISFLKLLRSLSTENVLAHVTAQVTWATAVS